MRLIAAVALLTGCTLIPKKYPSRYTHASKPADAYAADRYDCETAAKAAASSGSLNLMVAGNPLEAETSRCLQQKHGWVPAP